jgi:proline iminopeptidase
MGDTDFADYMRICMPLYNPPGTVAADQSAARRRAITRLDMMRYFSMGEIKTMNAVAALKRVTCPALVLAGGYDPVTPVSCAREIFDALPPANRRLEVFENAGHGIYRDEPDRAETLLRGFFAGT